MKVITAPEVYTRNEDDICIFLAGGITDCYNWQNDVIAELREIFEGKDDHLVLFNPRRENFPINDVSAAKDQITWEFYWLEHCDVFTMYFCESKSDQPICMYELGRNIARMQMRFPADWRSRLVISVESNYKRCKDVQIQSLLAIQAGSGSIVHSSDDRDRLIGSHILRISDTYEVIRRRFSI